jgi:HSP20 family protein
MSIIKSNNDPFQSDLYFPQGFNQLFQNFFDEKGLKGMIPGFKPNSDIIEKEKHYEIHLSIPGVKKEDVKITFEKDLLIVEGEKKHESKEENAKYYRREISYGKFSRSFHVGDADPSGIEASFTDGILNISIPKGKSVQTSTITIK